MPIRNDYIIQLHIEVSVIIYLNVKFFLQINKFDNSSGGGVHTYRRGVDKLTTHQRQQRSVGAKKTSPRLHLLSCNSLIVTTKVK